MQSATTKACIYSFVAICIFLILIFGCEREKLFELKLSTSEEHDEISQKSLELSGQSYFDQMRNVEGVNVREWRGDTIVYAEGKLKIRLHKGVSPREIIKYVDEFDPVYDEVFDRLGWGIFYLPEKDSLFPFIDMLERNQHFDIVEPVYVGTVASRPNDPYYWRQWHLKNTGQAPTYGTPGADINAEQAWQITTGSPDVVIAVLDTGMPRQYGEFSHEDLNNFYGWRFIPGNDYTGSGTGIKDENGHGTHVTGIAAANTNNYTGIAGVNHGSQVLVIKTNTSWGDFHDYWFKDAVFEASDYAANSGKRVVINFSSAGSNHSNLYIDAVQYANMRDVLIVASAGNENTQIWYPAKYSDNYSNVIAVGATDPHDVRSSYSNYGPELNLTAPGGDDKMTAGTSNIYSTMPDYEVQMNKLYPNYNQDYDYAGGTSMAAPQVAATAALMLSLDPDLTPAQLRSMLENSAYKVDGMNGEDFTEQYGYGRLDANMALVEVLQNKPSLLDDMLDIFGPDYVCESGGTFLLENLPEGFDQPQWTVTPSYMFNGSTSGTGIEAIVTPKPQYIGANASITYTVSGDWGSVNESMNFTLIGPRDDQLSINVVPSSGDAPWPIYTSGVWLVCPNTVYHIHINNSSDCQVYDFDWNLPSAWSVNYLYDNMISVNTNHDPSGTLEVYAKTCCYTNEPNKVKIKTQNFGMAYNCN